MKKLFLILFILTVAIPVQASMSKLYVGDEDGQFIYGIEHTAANVDAAIGGEVRTYLAKKGIVVNGVEYGSLPSRTKYNFHVALKGQNVVVRYDRDTYINHVYHQNNKNPIYENSAVSLRGGSGSYLLYE